MHRGTRRGDGAVRRVLGPWHLVLLGVGAIIGTGIFAKLGELPRWPVIGCRSANLDVVAAAPHVAASRSS